MSGAKAAIMRAHPLWLAYLMHRLSGVALALFLPLHFWVLAMIITEPEMIDGFLFMNASLLKTVAEAGLVFLLALHLFGGLRLMVLEWSPWSAPHKTLAAAAAACSLLISGLFFLQVI